ncbi:hypothetical protein IT401_00575 [Candidatus Nomurabacteria bacterium]|nr:hypothetical protein [Candidatus Nomurabacteria bacterium]
MKITYKKLQDYIVEPLPAVDVLREQIIFHAFEVESVDDLGNGDWELDVKVLPDRAHDAKDERGMAREVAALFGFTLKEPDVYEKGETVAFSIAKVSALLGREISPEEIRKGFDAYHYQYEIAGDAVALFVPPWRTDIKNIHDVCDELGRFLGYNTIPAAVPVLDATAVQHAPEYVAIMNKKKELIERGYHEVMTYSLTRKGDLQVAKGPKGKDFLRTDLLTGLRAAYVLNKQNEVLLPNSSANIFEIGKVFKVSGEELHVAWIDAKDEHEEVLEISAQGGALPVLEKPKNTVFQMWSPYPFIVRDIAAWVDSEEAGRALQEQLTAFTTLHCARPATLFDTFTKDGRTSVAYRLIFQASDRTLSDTDVSNILDPLLASFGSVQGVELR